MEEDLPDTVEVREGSVVRLARSILQEPTHTFDFPLLTSFSSPDENKGRRKLLQANQNIASAIRGALDNTQAGDGSGTLDVIGFDACLMQAVGAADDYAGVTKYILASEAVEPGHGWAYEFLSRAGSALELAQNMLETFLSETQSSGTSHQSPKTMAIVDVAKFNTFIQAFESFSADLLSLLVNGDSELLSFVSRARLNSFLGKHHVCQA